MLAPGRPDRPIQFIDVRDLAEWTLRMVKARQTGIYNADSQAGAVTMEQLLETCKAVNGSDATFTWVSGEFLAAHKVGEWMEMPLFSC